MVEKKCYTCGIDLTADNCTPSALMLRNRRGAICSSCCRQYQMKARDENPRLWILYASRARAKKRGRENSLVLSDIPNIPKQCPVFPEIKIVSDVGGGMRARDNAPALDRIDSKKGYVKGNVRIISNRANKLKSDATDEELVLLGRDAVKRIKAKTRN
jgi:hypothetical protein